MRQDFSEDIAAISSIAAVPSILEVVCRTTGMGALRHGAEDRPVVVEAHRSPDYFELSVSNAGEPIPPEIMAELFKPFVRASAGANQQGLGLGLYICSQIAKAHAGTLDVVSTAEGTRFRFRMPLAR